MTTGWAKAELHGIDLGDKRCDLRAIRLVGRLAERPTASIPGACTGWAETQAAYRFLGSEAYEWLDTLDPHRQCTQTRMAGHPWAHHRTAQPVAVPRALLEQPLALKLPAVFPLRHPHTTRHDRPARS